MKVLILSCNNGQGHNSCASALRDCFEANGDSCEVIDSMRFLSKGISRFAAKWHVRVYRYFPGLFRWGYSYSENHAAIFKEGSFVTKLLISGADQLREKLEEGEYDTVLCTHVFAAILLSNMQQTKPLPIKTGYITTDYAYTPGTEASELDYYFLPSEKLTAEFVKHGIKSDKLVASGIPVRSEIINRIGKNEAKGRLGIPMENKHLVIMCGSMGCGPIAKIVKRLMQIAPKSVSVTVVCGTNKKLKRKLSLKVRKDKRFKLLGYSDQVSELLDSADLFLTKPGGISVTEAAVKALPMAFINVVDGCERYNLRYFTDSGAAFTAGDPVTLAECCVNTLLTDGELEMKKQLSDFPYTDAANKIRQVICAEA